MRIETKRLIIRSIQRGDELIFSKMAKDGSLLQCGFDANCSEWINDWIGEAEVLTKNDNPRENYIPCVVALKLTGKVIGSVGSTFYGDVDKVGICYFIGTDYRQNGYMTEAVIAYVDYFFDHYKENEIMAMILDTNIASWKTAEKVDFKLVEKKMYKDLDDEKEELYRFYVKRK